MEIDAEMEGMTPRYLSHPSSPSQSDHPTQSYYISVTSTDSKLTPINFLSCQQQLYAIIIKSFPDASFKIVFDDFSIDASSDFTKDLLEKAPVKEVFERDIKIKTITIATIQTNLKLHDIRDDSEVAAHMTKYKMGFRKHYWSPEVPDVVRPFYILTHDPKYMRADDLLGQEIFSTPFAQELEMLNVKPVPATITQVKIKKTKNKKLQKAQAFALEVPRDSREKLLHIVQTNWSSNTTVFLPAQQRYKNKKSWNNAVAIQKKHNDNTKCISLTNINVEMDEPVLDAIGALPGVYVVCRRNDVTTSTSFNVRILRHDYDTTFRAIQELLKPINTPDRGSQIYISVGTHPQSSKSSDSDLRSFYSRAARSLASIQIDNKTNSISEITMESSAPKLAKGSYAHVVSPAKPSPSSPTASVHRIQELEEENRHLRELVAKLQLEKETNSVRTPPPDEFSEFKTEMRELLSQHTVNITSWVKQQMTASVPFTQEPPSPDEKLDKSFGSSSLAKAASRPVHPIVGIGSGRGRGLRSSSRQAQDLLGSVRKIFPSDDSASPSQDDANSHSSEHTDEVTVGDANMEEPTSARKRNHRELKSNEDATSVDYDTFTITTQPSLQPFPLTQPTQEEAEQEIELFDHDKTTTQLFREIEAACDAEKREKRLNTGRDRIDDPQSVSRDGITSSTDP